VCGELKLFSLCEGMKWNHLPMAGGLYDQHPGLLDRFYYILAERAKHEAAEQAKKKNDMGAHGPKPTSRSGVSRGRR
jgi:hypothetical protein